MSDSAFRRLLLDTVSAVITTRPPSTSSLVDLLRIATPDLVLFSSPTTIIGNVTPSQQQAVAESTVRSNVALREKLYRALQLKIHPDKHCGDERATHLFQDVTTYYERCVLAMALEPEKTNCDVNVAASNIQGTTVIGTKHRQRNVVSPKTRGRGGGDNRDDQSLPPQWIPPSLRAWWPRSTVRPVSPRIHSDYTNSDDDHERYRRTLTPLQRRQHDRLFPQRREHGCGGGGGGIAQLACLCIVGVLVYLFLRDGEFDWDWEKMKHDFEERSWGGESGGP